MSATPSSGGAFVPGFDYQPTGNFDLSKVASLTMPSAALTTYPAGSVPSSALPNGSVSSTQLQSTTVVGTSALLVAHATYSFAVDGGAVSTITPASTVNIPAKSIMLGGVINFSTAATSGGSATVAVGTSAGSSNHSLLTATAVASCTGLLAVNPTFAVPVELTAAGNITVTIAAAALTAGIAEIYVVYLVSAS